VALFKREVGRKEEDAGWGMQGAGELMIDDLDMLRR
jgi:hypothetical protein